MMTVFAIVIIIAVFYIMLDVVRHQKRKLAKIRRENALEEVLPFNIKTKIAKWEVDHSVVEVERRIPEGMSLRYPTDELSKYQLIQKQLKDYFEEEHIWLAVNEIENVESYILVADDDCTLTCYFLFEKYDEASLFKLSL